MDLTKIRSVVLDFTNAPVGHGRQVVFSAGMLKVIDHKTYLGDYTSRRFPMMKNNLRQVRDINDVDGYIVLWTRLVRERG